MNLSYPLFLISQLNQSCPSPTSIPCSHSAIASKYKNSSLECETIPQRCKVILQLAEEVPICNVSTAITALFQSDNNIKFDGSVTRAAVCGHSNSDNLLGSTSTWVNSTLQHAEFCNWQKNSSNPVSTQSCSSGQNLVVQLQEQCIPTTSTTASPTTSLNTSPSPNVTSVSPSPESRADVLLALSANVSALNSSLVDQLVSQLEDLLLGPGISLALANTTIQIVSNLLGASPEILANSANRIIRIVDTVGLKVIFEETETLLSPALALSVKAVDTNNPEPILFSISDPSNVEVRSNLRFPRGLRNDASIPQGSILLPDTLTQNLTSEELQMASRVHFNYYQKSTVFQDRSLGTRRLNSGILGASLANLTLTGLQDEVVIRLRNLQPITANYVVSCVFWDFALNNRSGGWNTNGCYVQNSTDNMTVCGCNHLTSFSILLDLAREPLTSRVQATVLTFITYIGCGISAIFLVLTLLTYLAFGKLRKDMPSKILIQLCVALLLLNMVFLVDAWLALFPDAVGLCISTAWFLHYFLLAVFTWMGLEGVHMYLALVKVFNTYVRCYMLWFSLAGWGLPLIVVIIVIAVDKDNYGLVSYGKYPDGATDDFCWLKNDIAFYVAVVAYFCLIFLFNFIMFVVVLVQLVKIKRQNPHNSKHRTVGKDVRSVVGLTILLGLTWGFAFFAWGPVNLPFMYLFAICNAFQGFFIFVFHCAVKDSVRRQWRTYLCLGKLRLSENSEWSRTATQKKPKRTPSSQSNNSSSALSFLSQNLEHTRGIGNPFEDRIITGDENPNSDVIFNELNRVARNRQTTTHTRPQSYT
ncbi:adhesion G-protein coupled receptor G2 [Stigmatopora nigra]